MTNDPGIVCRPNGIDGRAAPDMPAAKQQIADLPDDGAGAVGGEDRAGDMVGAEGADLVLRSRRCRCNRARWGLGLALAGQTALGYLLPNIGTLNRTFRSRGFRLNKAVG